MHTFPSSQTNMPTLFNSHDWRGQSNVTGSQVVKFGEDNQVFLETQRRCWGGPQPSFMEMMNAMDNVAE
ncbi:hypothetical protein RHMOL_Rhmol05G0097500 [Rhododendron molle]|uniref:Uncharacterized protein n=1 Tax=Rhododendron molle TaxID=49168 RepID=A0ACC0NM08_RHOML|nr:hypothetical protein RHMOL_Rhmol05G0097500 [Rhododendron molle]